jgi:hypothetical protein
VDVHLGISYFFHRHKALGKSGFAKPGDYVPGAILTRRLDLVESIFRKTLLHMDPDHSRFGADYTLDRFFEDISRFGDDIAPALGLSLRMPFLLDFARAFINDFTVETGVDPIKAAILDSFVDSTDHYSWPTIHAYPKSNVFHHSAYWNFGDTIKKKKSQILIFSFTMTEITPTALCWAGKST